MKENVLEIRKFLEITAGLLEALEQQKSKSTASATKGSSQASGGEFTSNLKSAALFKQMADGVKQNQDAAKNVKAIILYVITKNGKEAGKFSKREKKEKDTIAFCIFKH